jgi:hypothetical protein
MARWFAGVGLFFVDVFRHTVGILAGVVSIALTAFNLAFPSFFAGERGLLHSRWVYEVAAVLAYFVAAYSAWKQQRQQAVEAQRKLEDRRPRIAFSVASCRAKMWRYESGLFTLAHLGGDAAQFIQIQPVQSVRGGKLWITFAQVDFLDRARNAAQLDFGLDIGGFERGPDKFGNLYSVFFKREAPSQKTIDYRVNIRFKWNEKSLEENVILRWNTSDEVLTTHPVERT